MNYGSFLQAYALKTFLENESHEVFFFKWDTNRNLAWNSVIKPIIFRKSISIKGIKAGLGRIKSFKKVKSYFRETENIDGLDLMIVGSDTLWDVARENFRNRTLYGDFEKDIPAISYAVSCSDSTANDFSRYSEITGKIKVFKHILVRDRHTQSVVKKSLNIESEVVCDPTLLVEENMWKIYDTQIDLTNSIIVYAYELSVEIIEHLKRYKGNKGLQLISLCVYQPWCDLHINCSPIEFPSYLKRARHVVTNTFHGTIFSVLSESNLIVVKNGNKLRNLLEIFFDYDISLSQKCTYDEFLNKAFHRIDFLMIKTKIVKYREHSRKIFRSVLDEISTDVKK